MTPTFYFRLYIASINDSFLPDNCWDVYRVEKELHEMFREYRYIGEWFNIDPARVIKRLNELFSKNLLYEHLTYRKPAWLKFKTWGEFLQYYS